MIKLYVIQRGIEGVEIKELKVTKETPKTAKTSDGFLARTIRKSELPFNWSASGTDLVTDDLEAGKSEWNKNRRAKILKLKGLIERLSSELIRDNIKPVQK